MRLRPIGMGFSIAACLVLLYGLDGCAGDSFSDTESAGGSGGVAGESSSAGESGSAGNAGSGGAEAGSSGAGGTEAGSGGTEGGSAGTGQGGSGAGSGGTEAGSSGSSGEAGSAAGSGGSAGESDTGGSAGESGTGGSAGESGTGGSAGDASSGGSAGSAGNEICITNTHTFYVSADTVIERLAGGTKTCSSEEIYHARGKEPCSTTPETMPGSNMAEGRLLLLFKNPSVVSVLNKKVTGMKLHIPSFSCEPILMPADGPKGSFSVFRMRPDWAENTATWCQRDSSESWKSNGADAFPDDHGDVLSKLLFEDDEPSPSLEFDLNVNEFFLNSYDLTQGVSFLVTQVGRPLIAQMQNVLHPEIENPETETQRGATLQVTYCE